MQRVHMDDLTGFLLAQSKEWQTLSLSAIAEADEVIPGWAGRVYCRTAGEAVSPEREPIEVLNALKLQIGSDAFYAQYQQMPVPPGGAMIKRHWVRRYSAPPRKEDVLQIIQSWDTAMKGGPGNDYSVCTTWAQTCDCKMYLLDLWRGRVDYPTLRAKVLALHEEWRPSTILVEETGTAIGLIDELRYQCYGLVGVRPDRDKIARMAIASAKFEAGNIYLPESAPWLADLEAELFAFPGSRHDDQCDSISQALNDERAESLATYIKAYG
jgi:predicted phage terminase large subunit-like protein